MFLGRKMKSNALIGRFLETLDSLDKEDIKVPGLIMSSPGYGKTTTVEMWSEYHDYNLTTLIASQYSQDDILGIQAVNNGKLERLTPAWFNSMVGKAKNGKRNVLFIDEITTCDEFIQAPLLNLIFARNLGLHKLPHNTLIVTAGNYSEDLNGVFSLTAPLVNRFMILNLTIPDFDMAEVVSQSISNVTDLPAFLGINNDTLLDFDPSSLSKFIYNHVPFGVSSITNNSKIGLTGFTSVRSVHNSISYYKKYISMYNSSDWTRVVGDTLGIVERNGNQVLLRDLMLKNIEYFKIKEAPRSSESYDKDMDKLIRTLVIGKGDMEESYNDLVALMESRGVTEKEMKVLSRVSSVNNYLRNAYDHAKNIQEGGLNE